MARNPEGDALTEAHRVAQARLGAETALAVVGVWALLDPKEIDQTYERWLRGVIPIILGQRNASAALAGRYYTMLRRATGIAGGEVEPVVAQAATVERARLATSLMVVGPYRLKSRAGSGVSLEKSVALAETDTARVAMKHTLNGGRETLTRTVTEDPVARGYARVTSSSPCNYCARLASRGVVFGERNKAEFESHDGCACTAEPVWSDGDPLPFSTRRWKDAADDAAASPHDTEDAFAATVAELQKEQF